MFLTLTPNQLHRAVGIEPGKGRLYVQKFDGDELVALYPLEEAIEVEVTQMMVEGDRVWVL